MAGRPLTGAAATITSVTSSTDLNRLLTTALKNASITINQDAEEFDVSELSGSGSGAEYIVGLASGTFDFEGTFPKSAPRVGNSGLVTYASGYAEFVNSWRLQCEYGETDITAFAASAVTARTFMPSGVYNWSGSYTAHAVSGNAITTVTAANTAAASATFKITEDGAADPALSGNILATAVRQTIRKPDIQVCEYTFRGSGDVTETKGSTLPGLRVASTGAWGIPDWDTDGDGVADVQVVITTASSRTITAYAFLRSISIEVAIGQPIRVSGTVRFNGTITRA